MLPEAHGYHVYCFKSIQDPSLLLHTVLTWEALQLRRVSQENYALCIPLVLHNPPTGLARFLL